MNSEWPKKQPLGKFRRRWHGDSGRTQQSLINDIKKGRLNGGQEQSSAWYVWVNQDGSECAERTDKTGNALADSILHKYGYLEHGAA